MASTTVANQMGGSPPAKRPRGILKNPSHSSPPTSPNLIDQPIAAKEVTIANTHFNAGTRRTPSGSGPVRPRASSHTPSLTGDLSHLESSQRLKWDEANLYLTEQERTPKMKIDEPKTPFAKGYDPLDDPSDIEDGLDLGEPERQVPERRLSDGSRKAVHVADQDQHEELGMTAEEKEKHEKFEKMRKSHYEMRNAVQLLGHTEELLDEEEDDGDDAQAGRLPPPMPSIPPQFRGVNGS
ncbi:related to Glc8 protein [Cephalotrichum gorgonifer]|uniref:Related to Glc8 protein n=1 Tax=Cephalotrichum gorgonifer TaxID=2041049 RepID=A0AAE8SS47_9PEZI|nr:related to Glc8 protein [Cephalotrichum gorgonifer]